MKCGVSRIQTPTPTYNMQYLYQGDFVEIIIGQV